MLYDLNRFTPQHHSPSLCRSYNMEEEQCLHECESYIQNNNIQLLLKGCIVQLCVNKPENPVTFLRQYFQKLERVSYANIFSSCNVI